MKGSILSIATCLVLACCEAAAPAAELGGGAGTAPALAGPSTRGGQFTLRDVAGAPALVLFVRGSYCPLCRERLRALAAFAGAYEAAGVHVVAVTLDPPAAAGKTAHELDLPFPLVSTDLATFERWGVRSAARPAPQPGDFVLDAAGRVRYARVGMNAADRPSDVALLAVLDSLRAAGALSPR